MKIHREFQQKSWAWLQARAGKVTGSEMGNLITDKLAIRSWKTQMPQTYLHRKLAEKWRGEPLQSFRGNQQTDQGVIWEQSARRFFSSLLESDIEELAGIESDDGHLWCSPDGLISGNTGLEIKAGNADTQVGWLLAGGIPEEHVLQVQFGLWVSGFSQWWFLAWCQDLPHIAIPVERDDAIVTVMEEAVAEFNTRLDEAWNRLVELNGGPPPPRRQPIADSGLTRDTDPHSRMVFKDEPYPEIVP